MLSIMVASAFLALSIAVPFGPISLMCMQRALISDRWRGLACGAGASTAHAAFATLAFLGAHYAIGDAASLKRLVGPISGLLLIALGARILLRSRIARRASRRSVSSSGDYVAGLTLALCNPATILPYIALSGSHISPGHGLLTPLAATVSGVVTGSLFWYACLACAASALQNRISPSALRRLDILSGATMAAMGLSMIALGRWSL